MLQAYDKNTHKILDYLHFNGEFDSIFKQMDYQMKIDYKLIDSNFIKKDKAAYVKFNFNNSNEIILLKNNQYLMRNFSNHYFVINENEFNRKFHSLENEEHKYIHQIYYKSILSIIIKMMIL